MKTLQDIGERKAIEQIKKILSNQDLPVEIGDDCGVFKVNDRYILVTTDMISKHTHIPQEMTPWDIGWFVVAINLSDIAAKGGTPQGIVISYGLPENYSVSDFTQIVQGAKHCAETFDTPYLGGDTKENKTLTLAGTAIGSVSPEEFMSRYGAEKDDVVAVTGTLGKAAAGYYSLQTTDVSQRIRQGLIHPIPRINAGKKLASSKQVHCCMDLSDGLSSSLYQLGTCNQLGFEITREDIPVSPLLMELKKKDFDSSLDEALLHFGGDYELLFTTSASDFPSIKKQLASLNVSVTMIGVVTKNNDIILKTKKNKIILPNEGYQHFSR